jgi:hypothetical protein
MYQTRNSAAGEVTPKTPLRPLDLGQRMNSNPTVGKCIFAFRDLSEIREFHRDLEQIQDEVSVGRDLLMNRTQTSIAIGENSDRSGFIDSTSPVIKIVRAPAVEVPLCTKAKRLACPTRSSMLPTITSKYRFGRRCRLLTYPISTFAYVQPFLPPPFPGIQNVCLIWRHIAFLPGQGHSISRTLARFPIPKLEIIRP